MTSTISVFSHIATAELYSSVLRSHVQLHKQGQANSWFWCKWNRWTKLIQTCIIALPRCIHVVTISYLWLVVTFSYL